ncbi:MAG: uracil-xanthine permease [Clostridia bacterium]|nr:uracil-xanthine permease [Clostridia bacterium]MBR2473377.1 uracil-xanthine permease [Clostridia bacterium]
MNLVYGIKDKPKFSQLLIFAFQQVLAILAATIAVPAIVGNGMSASAALFGAGVGTIVYQLFTKFRSPVFLGSSFVFIGPMAAAFGGAVSASAGFAGLIIGAVFAGLVYVVIALIVKFAGVKWIDKVMPPVVIGPTVALIGLSLAGAAINDVFSYGAKTSFGTSSYFVMNTTTWVSMICALVTLFVVVLASTFGKKMVKLVPFIIGILAGYAVAAIFTVCGIPVIDFSLFENLKIVAVPEFSFMEAMKGVKDIDGSYIATVAVAYIPVAFVVFAEHLADHKNLSTIIDQNLIEEPGLHRTLLGDGVGSIAGAFFGGCPNTTYGESVGCVAITRNASVITITTAAIMCLIISFFGPFVAFLDSIPGCVMGGVCITLYGFIAVSGLKMIQKVDLGQNKNLFVVASILIPGIGGMAMNIGNVYITTTACALILGIVTNLLLNKAKEE